MDAWRRLDEHELLTRFILPARFLPERLQVTSNRNQPSFITRLLAVGIASVLPLNRHYLIETHVTPVSVRQCSVNSKNRE